VKISQEFAQHIALPAQIFAKVVPSFDASNIRALGTPHPHLHLIFLVAMVVFLSILPSTEPVL